MIDYLCLCIHLPTPSRNNIFLTYDQQNSDYLIIQSERSEKGLMESQSKYQGPN